MATIANDFINIVQSDTPRIVNSVLPVEIETAKAVDALTQVESPVTLSATLSDASAQILTESEYFIKVGDPEVPLTGTGLYLGDLGLFGVLNGESTFSITASGDATFKGDITGASGTFSGDITGASGTFSGDIETEGYIKSSGNSVSGFSTNWGDGLFDIQGSIYAFNTTVLLENSGKVNTGLIGRTDGVPAADGISAGVLGHVDSGASTTNGQNKIGVLGLAYDGGIGGVFYSDSWFALLSSSLGGHGLYSNTYSTDSNTYGALIRNQGSVGWGAYIDGVGGVYAVSTSPSTSRAVYGDGSIHTTQKFTKTNKDIGTLTVYEADGSTVLYTRKYVFN